MPKGRTQNLKRNDAQARKPVTPNSSIKYTAANGPMGDRLHKLVQMAEFRLSQLPQSITLGHRRQCDSRYMRTDRACAQTAYWKYVGTKGLILWLCDMCAARHVPKNTVGIPAEERTTMLGTEGVVYVVPIRYGA